MSSESSENFLYQVAVSAIRALPKAREEGLRLGGFVFTKVLCPDDPDEHTCTERQLQARELLYGGAWDDVLPAIFSQFAKTPQGQERLGRIGSMLMLAAEYASGTRPLRDDCAARVTKFVEHMEALMDDCKTA